MPLDSDVTLPRGRTWRDLPDTPPVAEAPAEIPDAMTPPPAQAVTVELPLSAAAPPSAPPTPPPAPPRRRPPWAWIVTGVAVVAAVAIVVAASPWDDDSNDLETVAATSPRRVAPLPGVTVEPDAERPDTGDRGPAPVEPESPQPAPRGEGEAPPPDSLEDLFGGGDFGEVLPPDLEDMLEDMLLAPEAVPGDPGLVPPELAPLFDMFMEEGFGADDGLDGVVPPELQRILARMLAGEELTPADLLLLLGSPEMQGFLDDLLGNG